jgi:anaerobic ribonucleoside-triphosphate reductase activating protein
LNEVLNMKIANTISDSIVDGPGLRFTIFTQGCPHHCPGCHNPDTHDPAGGREESVTALAESMLSNPLLEGLTLSGGEPFSQAAECAALARIAKEHGLTVWTYTGYTLEHLQSEDNEAWSELLAVTDVLVDGPFVASKKSYEALFRGSSNQRLIDLNATRQQGELVLWSRPNQLSHFTVPES